MGILHTLPHKLSSPDTQGCNMHTTELLEKLRQLPEELLIDLLGVNSDQIVDAFLDLIDEHEDRLHEYFNV